MAVEASTQALHGVGFDSVAHELKHGGYYVLLQGCFDAIVCLEPHTHTCIYTYCELGWLRLAATLPILNIEAKTSWEEISYQYTNTKYIYKFNRDDISLTNIWGFSHNFPAAFVRVIFDLTIFWAWDLSAWDLSCEICFDFGASNPPHEPTASPETFGPIAMVTDFLIQQN